MTPGGSFANIMGISLAIYARYPEYKQKGVKGLPNLRILTSDVSHYSFKKGAILCGLGMECIVPVKTNDNGQMDVENLEETIKSEIEKGNEPFFVCATAGTTVEGAIDDADKISEVAKKYKLWLHVDAAYGGLFLMSEKHCLFQKFPNIIYHHKLFWNLFLEENYHLPLIPQRSV